MRITAVEGYTVSVPVRPIEDGGIAPYRGSQDAVGTSAARSLLVAVRTDAGLTGWGELNTGFGDEVDAALVSGWFEPVLVGRDPMMIRAAIAALDKPYWPHLGRRALASAVEMALWDISGRALGVPVSTLLGGVLRDLVPIAFCLGITSTEVAVETARRIVGEGYTVLKTKIGLDPIDDVARIRAIVDATDGRLRLRLDANQGLQRPAALGMAEALRGLPIEYIEQPLRVGDTDGMRALVQGAAAPVAINEDAYLPGGIVRSVGATHAAVVDLEASGGVTGMLDVAGLAAGHGIPLAHHCGWDLGIKAAMMLQVVSALPAFTLASDSTYPMHLDDVLAHRIVQEGGALVVPQGPGIGIDVDEDAVRRLVVA